MSGEINISKSELEIKISEMKELVEQWNCWSKIKTTEISGGGMTTNAVALIRDSYMQLYESVIELGNSTIRFLERTNADIKETDEQVANAIESSVRK